MIVYNHYRKFKEILKSHAACWLTLLQVLVCYNFGFYRRKILRSRLRANINSSIKRKLCYYPENKIKIVLSSSLTAIAHFHAEIRRTNICCVTQKLSVRIIQARCSCCLLDNNSRIICRSLWLFACFFRKVSAFFFFKDSSITCKSTSLSIECYQRLIAWLVKYIKS